MAFRERFASFAIVGGLAICRWEDLFGALEEVLLKIALAAIPVYITVFILLFNVQPPYSIGPAILKNFENGELYLFCSSMLAAIFYISWKDRKDKPRYPNYRSHILIVCGMMFLSGLIFAFKRAGLWLSPEVLVTSSYFFFVIALILVILATTINNALNNNPAALYRAATNSFANDYFNHRGQ